jgi:methylmalonyl-CoA mutase C-terminal domain/subunit
MKTARILIAKPGLDGHDRGAKVVAHALRDAGFEVIYTGIRNPPEQIVWAAIEEDVDVLGLSCLSGAHLKLFTKVMELLREGKARDIAVIGGGIIPADDIAVLKAAGIKEVFTPGAPLKTITDWVEAHLASLQSRGEES